MITRPVRVEHDTQNSIVILDANDERVCSLIEDEEGDIFEIEEKANEIAEALNAEVKPCRKN